MISISRSQARRFSGLLRQLFPRSERPRLRAVKLQAGPDGLAIFAASDRFGLQFRDPDSRTTETITVAPELFATVAGSAKTPVDIDLQAPSEPGSNLVVARWHDHDVPRSAEFSTTGPCRDDMPVLEQPSRWARLRPEQLQGIAFAMQSVDSESLRYALNCIEIQGRNGTVAGTDGRMLFQMTGLSLGFASTILVPATTVLSHQEFAGTARIGITGSHVVIESGPWTLFLQMNFEGRFPDVEKCIPPTDSATSTLTISQSDLEFLSGALGRLPSGDEASRPVTLDLNGKVCLRARAQPTSAPTEMILRTSSRAGETACIATSRDYLMRAVKLGFRTWEFHGGAGPIVARDSHSTFLWMPLGGDSVIPADSNALVVESPVRPASAMVRDTDHRDPLLELTDPSQLVNELDGLTRALLARVRQLKKAIRPFRRRRSNCHTSR